MKHESIDNLLKLSCEKDENLNKLLGVDSAIDNEDIRKAIQDIQEQHKAETIRAAAKDIVEINKIADKTIVNIALIIRSARSAIRMSQKTINDIQLARAYGNETMDYAALMNALDISNRRHEAKVPLDYKPSKPIVKVEIDQDDSFGKVIIEKENKKKIKTAIEKARSDSSK